MERHLRTLCALVTLMAVAVPILAQRGHFVEVRMPVAPSPVPADGQVHLVYELRITNLSYNAATLVRVEASEVGRGNHLLTLEGEELARDLRILGRRGAPSVDQGISLPGGGSAIVYMWLSSEPGTVPDGIAHRISLFQVSSEGDTIHHELETEPLGLGPEPIVISPPFRDGDWWVTSWDGRRQNDHGHRRAAFMSVSGRAPIAQRFARDWNTVGAGETRGKEIVAVADGIVIEIKDGIPENESMTTRAVPITMETLLGNYVVLDIGNERYAVYAHLQPGLPVREGDSVQAGDALGLVGNSGNSMGNHLHFQIVDRPSPLGGEGMPYVFEYFEVIGQRLGRDVEFWDPEVREREMPMDGAIVRFR